MAAPTTAMWRQFCAARCEKAIDEVTILFNSLGAETVAGEPAM
jgi:hypothetical protein